MVKIEYKRFFFKNYETVFEVLVGCTPVPNRNKISSDIYKNNILLVQLVLQKSKGSKI